MKWRYDHDDDAVAHAVGAHLATEQVPLAAAHGRILAQPVRALTAAPAFDTVFAAGLLTHLTDFRRGLAEIARVTRLAGQLVVFHPTGRAALAARHGNKLRPDEPLSEDRLTEDLAHTGWHLDYYDDPPHRFLALATRS